MTATATPAKRTTAKPKAGLAEQIESDDELLAYILGKDHPHWSALKLAGGTDSKIEQALNFTLNLETPWEAISDRRPRSFRVSKKPQAIWFDQVDMHGPPTFKGSALIEVRDVAAQADALAAACH